MKKRRKILRKRRMKWNLRRVLVRRMTGSLQMRNEINLKASPPKKMQTIEKSQEAIDSHLDWLKVTDQRRRET